MLKVEKFVVNPLQENTYVISDETGECIFVDPGFYFRQEHREIKEYVTDNQLKPVMIANTHCHFDHIMGVEFIREEYEIPFCAHPDDAFWVEKAVDQGEMFGFEMKPVGAPNSFFHENETLEFGNTSFRIIHVPGHSPGHVVFYAEKENVLIGGDVLFYGSIGRTDLPGGDHQTLISNIKNKLFSLPGKTKVFCGHGPETTLEFEKTSNPFLT
ncbi:MBL fold metallo-hydrolase [Mariniphaga sediminis]|jgi:glyoxylase-like metal-dependent hydrolase (beta-lactamase superfamily II)|uniref:MBL fold metallo-hydrolase n=1 Tax=Mariniphaga sediminis TaxID=1628158 RepID=A0A399D4S2_9BACT|nr:MBL fold metallo-hydrolase [Mariniphaga sediminis]RIH65741.1 MBL fold metallo-hydrolase [Mariniphaga sediminis]